MEQIMACSRTAMRTVFLSEQPSWLPFRRRGHHHHHHHHRNNNNHLSGSSFLLFTSTTSLSTCSHRPSKFPNPSNGCRIAARVRKFHHLRRQQLTQRTFLLNCSYGENDSSSSSHDEQGPPQEAVLKAISEVSKTEGRVGQTTNVIIGGTVTNDSTNEWLTLDQKVNSYPTVRGFTAIGTGGDDFVQSMIVAVESVLQQPIPEGRVRQKLSSRGKYVSVNIGPVRVSSSEQVQAVYNAMRRDDRMKYFL